MDMEKTSMTPAAQKGPRAAENRHHGRIVSTPDDDRCLNPVQLNQMEASFRKWAEDAQGGDMRLSRLRVLIIFLLIRYTGAKLNEVLHLRPALDCDFKRRRVRFQGTGHHATAMPRTVQLSAALSRELEILLAGPCFQGAPEQPLKVDPGFVRRKFYERSQAAGCARRLGGPEMIRKARAVELMQGNMPLPAVQMLLGHSTPNLTSSYVSFSTEDIQQVVGLFMEREATRKTSARNSFFGKIREIQKGDITASVCLTTISGCAITTVITSHSLELLGLREGGLITAEVKAPWVVLQKSDQEPPCSAENRFRGVVSRVITGDVNTEVAVRIDDGTELAAVVSTEGIRNLAIQAGETVWAMFNCFAVVLHVD